MSNISVDSYYPLDANTLPSGWSVGHVGDVITEASPGFASGKHNQEGRGVPHIRPMNIDREGTLDLSVVKYVTATDERRLRLGDVLFNNTNSPALIGKTTAILTSDELAYSNHMTRLRPGEGMSARFLARQLHYLWMTGYFRHRCVHHVNQASLSTTPLTDTVPILVAPSPEQERIADKLDELFTDLDAGVAALERVQRNLERYRASVLKAAVAGRLTEDWRAEHPDVEPAPELLTRILVERQERWEQDQLAKYEAKGKKPPKGWQAKYKEPVEPDTTGLPELPNEWQYCSLDLLARPESHSIKRGPFGSAIKKEFFVEAGYKVYEQQHAIYGDFQSGSYYVDQDKYDELSAFRVAPGDLIISCSGTVGKTAIVPPDAQPGIINQALLKLSLNQKVVLTAFFQLLFTHRLGELLRENVRGSAMVNITGVKDLKAMAWPVPPIGEQQAILEAIGERSDGIDRVQDALDKSHRRASRLRQSLLKRAFEGRLVPQDPSDESASVLLERIAEQRARDAEAAKKSKKKTASKKRGRRRSPKKNTVSAEGSLFNES